MRARALMVPIILTLVVLPATATPSMAATNGWVLLETFTAGTAGAQLDTFAILPAEDYDRYLLRVESDGGTGIGTATFQISRSGLVDNECRGVLAQTLEFHKNQFCDSLRPNNGYHIVWVPSTPDMQVKLYGFDLVR
ncbi:MAG: hypothetical protein KY455_02415 [Euryarchaeota archaeon]|nr:hypothetical protein [Euryarchaeota archaeon]